MPCHGLCLAYVHVSEHDIALFIYISFQGAFPISFLLYPPRSSHFCCYCHSSVIVTSAVSRPWESYIMEFAMYYHTCMNVPECSGPPVAVLTVCTHAPSDVYARSHVSPWLQRSAHWCPLGACFRLSAECGDSRCHHAGRFFPDWPVVERTFLVARKHSNRRLISPRPFVPPLREALRDGQSLPHTHPANRSRECGPSEGYHVFLTCANVHVADPPLFPLL